MKRKCKKNIKFKLIGLDFAWSKDGSLYHTKFVLIHLGSFQRTGNNVLAYTIGIVSGYYLSEENYITSEGSLVFFYFIEAIVNFY